MIASYILSRTLVPTLAMYLLKAHKQGDAPSRNVFARFQRGFERLFERIRSSYSSLLAQLVSVRLAFVPCFVIVCLLAFALVPFLGQNFFRFLTAGGRWPALPWHAPRQAGTGEHLRIDSQPFRPCVGTNKTQTFVGEPGRTAQRSEFC
jgi:Cu/Ag efflux pump CusA